MKGWHSSMNFFHELEAKYGGRNHIMIGKFLASAQLLKGLLFGNIIIFLIPYADHFNPLLITNPS